jgi:hypothetical protein
VRWVNKLRRGLWVMLCLWPLVLQLEFVQLRNDRGSGGRNCGQNGSSALEGRNAPAKRQEDVDSFIRITAHFMGHYEINGIPRHPFICLIAVLPVLPVLKGPVQLQCRLGEDPFSCPSRR